MECYEFTYVIVPCKQQQWSTISSPLNLRHFSITTKHYGAILRLHSRHHASVILCVTVLYETIKHVYKNNVLNNYSNSIPTAPSSRLDAQQDRQQPLWGTVHFAHAQSSFTNSGGILRETVVLNHVSGSRKGALQASERRTTSNITGHCQKEQSS
jgi:hypothetical protein